MDRAHVFHESRVATRTVDFILVRRTSKNQSPFPCDGITRDIVIIDDLVVRAIYEDVVVIDSCEEVEPACSARMRFRDH